MDVFQHVSDVDIHLVNMEDLTPFHWKLADTLSLLPSIFYMLFVGSACNFHE